MTSLPPAAVLTTITARHPVAWKSGTLSKKALGMLAPLSSTLPVPKRSVARWAMKNMFIRFVTALRCEPTAPLGWPVVPEV